MDLEADLLRHFPQLQCAYKDFHSRLSQLEAEGQSIKRPERKNISNTVCVLDSRNSPEADLEQLPVTFRVRVPFTVRPPKSRKAREVDYGMDAIFDSRLQAADSNHALEAMSADEHSMLNAKCDVLKTPQTNSASATPHDSQVQLLGLFDNQSHAVDHAEVVIQPGNVLVSSTTSDMSMQPSQLQVTTEEVAATAHTRAQPHSTAAEAYDCTAGHAPDLPLGNLHVSTYVMLHYVPARLTLGAVRLPGPAVFANSFVQSQQCALPAGINGAISCCDDLRPTYVLFV